MARRIEPTDGNMRGTVARRSGLVRTVAELLSAETPLADLWSRCCEHLVAMCDARRVSIALCDAGGERVVYRFADGHGAIPDDGAIAPGSLAAEVLSSGETVVRDAETDPMIGVPVRFGRALLGAICVEGIAVYDAELMTLLESCALYVAARIDYENVLQSSERYEELALSDGLTGIANRRRFDEALAAEWRRSSRERKSLTLLMLDVDHFKLFNDQYGHDAGDVCLKQVARCIEEAMKRPADLIARYGGEEFVALLPGTDQSGGIALAESILASVRDLGMAHSGSSFGVVSLSIGVAAAVPTSQTLPELLLRAADRALYEAKHAGRNRVASSAMLENLPATITPFVGRAVEVAEVETLLATNPLVTVTGAGGAGKTRVALQVARETAARFEDGAWFVDLSRLSNPAAIAPLIASALSEDLPLEGAALPLLVRLMENKRALLILDSCEHLVQAAAEVVVNLLRACPNLRVLATSREELGILGEAIYRLPLLSLPARPGAPLRVKDALASDAVALFAERAKSVDPNFALTDDNVLIVTEICRRLEGLPLAIEFAAAQVATLELEQLAKFLPVSMPPSGQHGGPGRQQTMTALVDWSYELLPENERVLFRRLSVFPGSWTLDAAADICVGDGIEADDVFDLVAALIRKSLVIDEVVGDDNRYRLLAATREYARDKLAAAGELGRLVARHAASYSRAAQDAGSGSRAPRKGVSAFGVGLDGGQAGLQAIPVPQALP